MQHINNSLAKEFKCNNKCDHNRNEGNYWTNGIMIPSLLTNGIFTNLFKFQAHCTQFVLISQAMCLHLHLVIQALCLHLHLVIVDAVDNLELQISVLFFTCFQLFFQIIDFFFKKFEKRVFWNFRFNYILDKNISMSIWFK